MKEPNQYAVPPAALNVVNYGTATMPCKDEVYSVPDEWLQANASRFHFTDQQIIDAARQQFEGDRSSIVRFYEYPAVCGIYFLVAKKKIIYVGQSNRIPRRIFQHRDNLIEFDSLSWFEAPELYLKDIEGYYIRRISPPLNTDKPGNCYFDKCVESIGKPVMPTVAPYLLNRVAPKKRNGSAKYHAERWLRLQAETKAKREAEALAKA